MQITALGDSALIVRVRDQFEDAPEETLNEVFRAFHLLRDAGIPGVIDLAPAYTSVAIFFDPIVVAKVSGKPGELFDWLAERVREIVTAGARRGRRVRRMKTVARPVEIPVCYSSRSRSTSIEWRNRHKFLRAKWWISTAAVNTE